ncbi:MULTISPECIES: hypothetical protein [Sphingobium]|jgi:hypothetical protein|uniref:TRAG family protein n=1 Tax=Sphingobium yanoikuyae TaxID=13690 RepID=A0A084E1U6_SPHYA|nr:hypothetical protein [Sphingobium yanoikuyae]KEZ11938.1 TRAG family protein [Sphingobium yanoikuyae]MDG2516069.1 hypothetical protein [Sphingobium yanoikuyae]HEV7436149.1 hypothetical protein [Pseudorhizobium sp.]
MTRMLTADELAGFAEIIDNMLVLGDLAELPAPATSRQRSRSSWR